MASEKLFAAIPPFPDDLHTASLPKISLTRLHKGDNREKSAMLSACQGLGFFLLDLHDDEQGEELINTIDELFAVEKQIFDISDEIKKEYMWDAPRSLLGFKLLGFTKTETAQPDRTEWFNISQDTLLNTPNTVPQPLPPLFQKHLPLLTRFLHSAQSIVHTISTALALHLNLPATTFTALQPLSKPSGTVIRFIKAPACIVPEDKRTSLAHHGDFGTVTLLANVLGGLQILAPDGDPKDPDAWLWVRPEPGCLIVNLGDVMDLWTSGLLRSNIHRVRYPPGEQAGLDRYSLALFVRPEKEASMRRLVGKEVEEEDVEDDRLTAGEWEAKRMMMANRGQGVIVTRGGRRHTTAVGVDKP